jgi:AraC-like DNA-binding protein
MRDTRRLVHVPGIDLYRVGCAGQHAGWSRDESVMTFAIVLVSEGMFRRRTNGNERVIDSVTAYVQCPGEEQQVSHPCGGDLSTVIVPSERIVGDLGDPARLTGAGLLVSPEVDLAHRLLLSRARSGADADELAEQATVVAGGLLDRDKVIHHVRASRLEHWLAWQVREAIDAEVRVRLVDMAAEIGVSAYRLSRAFRRVTGLSVTSYRSELRTRQALARLAQGDQSLAGIAADVGFADQAHLTRTLRASSGMTPRMLQSLLGPPAPGQLVQS